MDEAQITSLAGQWEPRRHVLAAWAAEAGERGAAEARAHLVAEAGERRVVEARARWATKAMRDEKSEAKHTTIIITTFI